MARQSVSMVLVIALGVLFLLSGSSSWADTIYLGGGKQLKDCQVIKRDGEMLHLRTRDGKMVIRRDVVLRIEKRRTVFDKYEDKRARVKDDDAWALYQLAVWCKAQGLRPEMRTLLRKVLAADTDHVATRGLLGYVRDGEKWIKLPRFSVTIDLKNEKLKDIIHDTLSVLVAARGDIKIVESLEDVPEIHSCPLRTQVSIGATPTGSFFGLKIEKPFVTAQTRMSVGGKVGRGTSVSVRSEAPSSMSNAKERAIRDSFMQSSRRVHAFFDRILRHRLQAIEASLRTKKVPPEKKAGSGS